MFYDQYDQAFGRLSVATGLQNLVDHIFVLIDGAPKTVVLASNDDAHTIEKPYITAGWMLAGADGIQRRHRTGAALQEHFFDHAEAERKTIIEPHSPRDDLTRKAMAFIANRYGLHTHASNP